MVISKQMFKRETVEKEFTLIDAGDGEIDKWSKTNEGKFFIDGKTDGLILLWQDDGGEQLVDSMTKSMKSNSTVYNLLSSTYGKPGKKALQAMTNEEYVNDANYYYGLLEYLIGQKFMLTMEVGKFTKIKDREIIKELPLPSKEEVEKRSKELEVKATIGRELDCLPDEVEDDLPGFDKK